MPRKKITPSVTLAKINTKLDHIHRDLDILNES
jgi:DNA repair photolyase